MINYKHLSQCILSIVFKAFVHLLSLFARWLSPVRPFCNPGACQAPLFMGLPRQENCRALPSPTFSRRSFQPRDRACVSCIGRRIFYPWATWGPFLGACTQKPLSSVSPYRKSVLWDQDPPSWPHVTLIPSHRPHLWIQSHDRLGFQHMNLGWGAVTVQFTAAPKELVSHFATWRKVRTPQHQLGSCLLRKRVCCSG